MNKLILVLGALGSTVAMTSAGAAGLGALHSGTLHLATSSTTTVGSIRCTDGFAISYTLKADGETIDTMVVRDTTTPISADCIGDHVDVKLYCSAADIGYSPCNGYISALLGDDGVATYDWGDYGFPASEYGISDAVIVVSHPEESWETWQNW